MAVAVAVKLDNLQDLVERLGNIPLSRVRLDPPPGLATEADVVEAERGQNRLCELVDGVLVEKGMGYGESLLAGALIEILRRFVRPRKLGLVSAPDGMLRLFPGLVRIPDVAFASWDRFPDRKVPKVPVPAVVPDLIVEVLSASNTLAEMDRKRAECFDAGVRLIWEVDPASRSVSVYTPDGTVNVLDASQTLEGGEVLPGFALVLSELFAELDEQG
jgi:Uma2 family endonuclease